MRIIKRTITPALAFLLALLMAIYLFPADVAAAAYGGNDPESQSNEQEETVEALFELTDLRAEDTKYIMMSDGTIQALVYDTAVHVQDESGVWQDIDNRLTVGNNTVDSARVKFAKKITGNGELFTLHDGNKKVTLSLADAIKKTPVTVVNDGTTDEKYATKLEELSTLSKVVSSVRYNGILPNTDVEYILSGNDLKENIVINALQDYYTYTFELALNNLTAVLSEDGSVVMSDGEETVYTIPVPYMYDAEGAFSDAVTYTLTEGNGNGKYALTITANADWINDSDRTFPITVDPTITLNGNNATNASVSSDGGVYSYYMDAGVASGVSYRSYISFTLPSLPDGSIVTEAKLKLYQDNYHLGSANTAYIAVRQITSSWTASSLRWANKPNNSDDIMDYATVSSTTTGSRLSFDITPVYKKWNAGSASNYGVMLSAVDESNCGGYVQLGGTGFASAQRPILEVNFRNTRGVEDRFTYQTLNAGNAGVLYLSDNSLEKTVIKNITYTNAGSVDLVYNSVGASAYPVSSNMLQIAKGWSLSVQQTITAATYSPHEYAVWVDEDGTSHYYDYASGNGFIDEDNNENVIYLVGLNVMSVDLSEFNHGNTDYSDLEDDYRTYLLVKSTDEKELFYNGVMIAAVDSVGNITEYHYNESTPSSAKSLPTSSAKMISSIYTIEKTETGHGTAELCVSFAKSGNDTVITVTDEDPVVLHADTNGDLVNITRNSDPIAAYTYSNHELYDLCDVEEGYGFVFSLNGMTEMNEYFVGENNVVETGRKVYITGGGTHTTYVDHRNDSNVALLVNYLFDKAGRTVCTYANDFLFNVYSAANYEYDTPIGGTSTRSDIYSATGTLPWNLLTDSSAENSGTEGVSRTGKKSIFSTGSDIQAYSLNLSANQEYTFSAHVNLENATDISVTGGAYLKVAKGSEEYESYKLFTKTDTDSPWQRIYVTFTPETTGTYTLSLCRTGITGTIYFDDLQLETGKDLSDYSLVSNGAFTAQNGWTCSDSTAVSYTTESTPGVADWSCIQISGTPSAREYANQDVILNSENKSYTLSGWAKANSVTLKEERTGEERTFGLIAIIDYTDPAVEDETVYIPFSEDIRGEWQFISGRVTPATDQSVDKITVYAAYDYNCGNAYFTGISMVESDVYTVPSGAEVEEEEKGGTTSEPEEPETVTLSEMLSCLGISGSTFASYLNNQTIDGDIEYYSEQDENTDVYTKIFSNDLFYATVQQDAESDANRTWYTMTLSVYDADGNLICTEDTLGGLTRYTYTDGVMTAETSPRGTVTEYTYSGEQLISASVANKAQVLYNYTGNRLTGVTAGLNDTHGTQGYTFEYNAYGQLSAVKAGNYTLVSYSYDNDGINITSVTYGNGLVIGYSYDMLDRVTEIKYNNVTRYKYAYTGESTLLSVEDAENNTKKVYLDSGKVTSALTVNTQTGKVIAATYTTLNDEGQTTAVKECFYVGSEWKEETTAYTYSEDGDLTEILAGGETQNYSYDALKRMTGIAGNGFTKTFGYRTENGRTCDLVGTLSYDRANGTNLLSLGYEYDAAGNITKVKKGDVVYNQYAYDELGQLIREDNRDANKSYTYSYDSRGNVLEKKTYAFTLNTLGTEQSTVTYGYATDSWKDRLTSYNGNPITYDNGGNPLTYNNGSSYTFTWEGRQMQTAKKGNAATWSYTYNADGLRTGKSSGSTVYTYTWNENRQLQSMTWNYGYAIFSYDVNGTPYSVKNYDAILDVERTYLYVTNLQGDVLSVVDGATGQTAVSYVYDAWGKLISKSGTSSDYASIYEYNPLTYRGYIYDSETGFYYLQSRYYDPTVGRFLNADDGLFWSVGSTGIACNLFTYCENSPVNLIDKEGKFGSPVQWVCATIGGIAGWFFGDYVARNLGYYPSGHGWWNAAKYWVVRAGITIGGAVVGWFAGTTIINLAKAFLVSNPNFLLNVVLKLGIAALRTKIIYDMVKMALFDAGSIVLSAKKCQIAKEAYYRGLYGGGKKWSSSKLNDRIKKNSYFNNQLRNAMNNVSGDYVTNKKISLEFTSSRDTDLYLTLGHIDLYVTGRKVNGKWYLDVKGTDVYNFDKFLLTTGFSIGNLANDVGLIMQSVGMMKTYTIEVSFSTVI